jgi:hypothetical protein
MEERPHTTCMSVQRRSERGRGEVDVRRDLKRWSGRRFRAERRHGRDCLDVRAHSPRGRTVEGGDRD